MYDEGKFIIFSRKQSIHVTINPSFNVLSDIRECRDALKELRGEEFSYPVLAFHGTKQEYITPICEGGFKVPGLFYSHPLFVQARYLKDQPICYGTSLLKNGFCVNLCYAYSKPVC